MNTGVSFIMMANLYTLNRWIILGLSQNLWDYHKYCLPDKDGCDYQVHCHTVVPVQFIEAFNFEHNIQFIFTSPRWNKFTKYSLYKCNMGLICKWTTLQYCTDDALSIL